jgi:hypothetical protein
LDAERMSLGSHCCSSTCFRPWIWTHSCRKPSVCLSFFQHCRFATFYSRFFRLPDGTQVARWYSGCPMVLRLPDGTQDASWYSGCLMVLRLPRDTTPGALVSQNFTATSDPICLHEDRVIRVSSGRPGFSSSQLDKKRRNKGQVLRYSLFSLTAILLLRRTRGGRGPALASSYPHATYSKFRHDILG